MLRHWRASYYPVIGPDGEPIGVGAVVEETTDRRHAEQRERAARAEAEAAAATLRKLERVSQAALEHLSLQDLLDALLERIVEVLEADTAAILLVEADGNLHVRATAGGLGGDSSIGIPIGEGMAGRVAANRAPLLVPDLSKIELYRSTLRDRGINSIVAIPLVVEDRVIGVVHAGSEAYAQFVEDDARLLELIADRIALAINQASLYEAERAAQQRLRFLGEAGALLGSSLDVEKTLEQLGAARRRPDRGLVQHSPRRRGDGRAARLPLAPGRPRERTDFGPRCQRRRRGPDRRGRSEAASPRATRRAHVVPLNARGRTFGAMSLGWDTDERRDDDERSRVRARHRAPRRDRDRQRAALRSGSRAGAGGARARFGRRRRVLRRPCRLDPHVEPGGSDRDRPARVGRRRPARSRGDPGLVGDRLAHRVASAAAALRRGRSRCRSISAAASSGSRSTALRFPTASSTHSATSPRSVRSSECAPSSSRPSRTSCGRRSPRSTAQR